MSARQPYSRESGFTLIEVIVALSLVAVLMLGLVSALVTFGNTGSRLEQRALRSDEVRLVHGFLRQSLAAASPQQFVRESDQASTVRLRGDERQLEWLGLMPARHGAGGLYHLRLRVDDLEEEGRLVLDYRPYVDESIDPEWLLARTHVLIERGANIRIGYMRTGTDYWLPIWDDPEVLPGLIRIGFEINGEVWPELAVAVLEAEPGSVVDRPAEASR